MVGRREAAEVAGTEAAGTEVAGAPVEIHLADEGDRDRWHGIVAEAAEAASTEAAGASWGPCDNPHTACRLATERYRKIAACWTTGSCAGEVGCGPGDSSLSMKLCML